MTDIDTAEPAAQVDPGDRAVTVLYDAFISYSHAKDKPLAVALQSVMQRLGKPWYRCRALRLFATTPASVPRRIFGARTAGAHRRDRRVYAVSGQAESLSAGSPSMALNRIA
jgi:hypothetical protein